MNYTSPDAVVYVTTSTVLCSFSGGVDKPGDLGGNNGPIELPFIPG